MYDTGRSSILRRARVINETLPALIVNSGSRQKVRRHKSFTTRANYTVPEPGNEYDFRRSPEMRRKRQTPTKLSSVRPSVPHDTRTRYGSLDQEDYNQAKYTRHARIDESRCPKQMPRGLTWENCSSEDLQIGPEMQADSYSVHWHDFMAQKPKPSHRKYEFEMSDSEDYGSRRTPVSPLNLTETVINYYFQTQMDRDKRIVKWLADCDEKCSHSLPAHLPQISITRNSITISPQ